MVLAASLIAGACGPTEIQRLSSELKDRLIVEAVPVTMVLVLPPRGTVPHWIVELEIDGNLAAAWSACRTVERIAIYDGAPPYLVRVGYGDRGEVVECGTSRASPAP